MRTSLASGGTAFVSRVKIAFMYPSMMPTRHARSHSLTAAASHAGSCAMALAAAANRNTPAHSLIVRITAESLPQAAVARPCGAAEPWSDRPGSRYTSARIHSDPGGFMPFHLRLFVILGVLAALSAPA